MRKLLILIPVLLGSCDEPSKECKNLVRYADCIDGQVFDIKSDSLYCGGLAIPIVAGDTDEEKYIELAKVLDLYASCI